MYNYTSTDGVTGENNDDVFCCVDTGPNCCNNQSLVFVANDWDFVASASFGVTKEMTTSLTATSSSGSSSTSSSVSTMSDSSISSGSQTILGSFSVFTVTESMTGTLAPLISTTTAASTTSTATTTPENTSGAKRDWTGIGIGVGVGAAVPLLALIVVGSLLWRRYRHRHGTNDLPPVDGYTRDSASTGITRQASTLSSKPAFLKGYEAGRVHTYELDSVAERVGLPLKSPRELPGSEGERQRFQTSQSG